MVNITKLKQIRDLRRQAKKMQNTLAGEVVAGGALGNQVQVSMDGNQDVTAVHIDPTLLNAGSQKRLEDGVRDATNSAIKEVRKVMAKKLRAGEIEMPDLSTLKQ